MVSSYSAQVVSAWTEADEDVCPDCYGTGLDRDEIYDCPTCYGEGVIVYFDYEGFDNPRSETLDFPLA